MKTLSIFPLLLVLLTALPGVAQTTRQSSTTVIINGDTTISTTETAVTRPNRSNVIIRMGRDRASRQARQFSKDFGVYIGLNNYSGTAPAGFDLRPGASRFVALSWRRNILLNPQGIRATRFRLGIGPEIAWNNFALYGRNVLIDNRNPISSAQPGLNIVEDARDLKKSKLTTCQFNVPVILNIALKSGLTLGVGAYAGIRLDSYTKVKPEGGDPIRDHGAYELKNVRWGLTTEFGWQDEVHLFIRYEPSGLFRDGQGPNVNAWAVGFRL